MLLVAVALIAIIAMAALSIDVVTLYLAREEAQRAADAAALAAARVISISGITGTANPATDTSSWTAICGAAGTATQAAQAVGIQNSVGSISGTTTVTYSAGGSSGSDCSALPVQFAVNPMVTVAVTRTSMPTFFSRIWGRTGNSVSASATAEAYNPSDSGSVDNGPTGTITPVLPGCVKPFIVPNQDPLNPGLTAGKYCGLGGGLACQPLVNASTGQINHPGISLNGSGTNGTVGETFWLSADCKPGVTGNCKPHGGAPQPVANYSGGGVKGPPDLLFAPGQVGTPTVAVPSCTTGDLYEEAIEGCDESTNYQCGQPPPNNNIADLTRPNPAATGIITTAVQCLTGQTDATNTTSSSGQDYLNAFEAPSAYPYQILAGSSNPLSGLSGKSITSSNSIISLPIYDSTAGVNIVSDAATNVTFIGFLQVFINAVDTNGNINVTVLNVTGCSNGAVGNPNPVGSPVLGTSPVPIRLITPP
jgi:Flp pilus assembly protein TadG